MKWQMKGYYTQQRRLATTTSSRHISSINVLQLARHSRPLILIPGQPSLVHRLVSMLWLERRTRQFL